MAAPLRQITLCEHYVGLYSRTVRLSPSAAAAFFADALRDFERCVTTKLFDMNRTLTSLLSTRRREATIDRVHREIVRTAFGGRIIPQEVRTITVLEDFFSFVPVPGLVRRHPSLDYCLILPLSTARSTLTASDLATRIAEERVDTSDMLDGHPLYGVVEGELLCPLEEHSGWVRCFSPYPGEAPGIQDEAYAEVIVGTRSVPLLLPPSSASANEDEYPDDQDEATSGYLRRVQKSIGAFAERNLVKRGDHIFLRKKLHLVRAVTGGGESWEFMGGMDMIALDPPPDFNARKSPFLLCKPVVIMAKTIVIPKEDIKGLEPVQMKYQVKKNGNNHGSLSFEFSSLAFNKFGICHRDAFVPV